MKNTSAIRAFSFTFEAAVSLAVGEEGSWTVCFAIFVTTIQA